jgi:diaminohydroxyphosphoribosylaminopyrimidine deaminase / 5-amino-6-(5-phosphoribosylamino)uracil reductase
MRRAIALSAFGLGGTSPNPPVGCVVLDANGRIAGEGYHTRKGEAHAETQALAAAGRRAEGGTAAVTLEPCNHHGRTPPCRQALIDARVARVVIALIDPTSRGEGGAAALRAHGIDVEVGVLANEAHLVLGTWAAALGIGRPVVTWPYALDTEVLRPLPADVADARLLRLNSDAVLHDGGKVSEAVPYSHGAGILRLVDVPPGTPPQDALGQIYAGGVRALVLDGGLSLAGPFLAAGLVDRVVVYVADALPSRRPGEALPWPLLPPGFTMTSVTRIGRFARVEAILARGALP